MVVPYLNMKILKLHKWMLDGPFSILVNCNGRVENYQSGLHKRTSKLSIGVNHFGNDELHWRASKLSTVVSYSNNEKLQRCISKLSIVVSYFDNEKLQRCTNKLSTGKKKNLEVSLYRWRTLFSQPSKPLEWPLLFLLGVISFSRNRKKFFF